MVHASNESDPKEPIDATKAQAIPLSDLPVAIRRAAHLTACARAEWEMAYGHYRERQRALILYYHRDQGLGITAAEMKADIDPAVVDAAQYSLELKQRVAGFEAAERQLLQEFQLKLALAQTNSKP